MNIYESTKNPFELMYLFNPQPKNPSARENIIKLYGFSNKFSLAFHVQPNPKMSNGASKSTIIAMASKRELLHNLHTKNR